MQPDRGSCLIYYIIPEHQYFIYKVSYSELIQTPHGTLWSTSFVSLFCSRHDSGASELSAASQFSGEASRSERFCAGATGLERNTESVSECRLRQDGEKALDDRVAFRFSAGIKQKEKHTEGKCADFR